MDKRNYDILSIVNRVSEGQAMTRCQASKNVVKFIEEFSTADKVYLVTKFYEGGDLVSYLDRLGVKQFSEDDARQIVA